MIDKRSLVIGAGAAIAVRASLPHAILVKLRRDLRRLNAGDYRPLLSGYADDAVLRFNEGPHRWSGEHRGKAAIEGFLREFVGAGIKKWDGVVAACTRLNGAARRVGQMGHGQDCARHSGPAGIEHRDGDRAVVKV